MDGFIIINKDKGLTSHDVCTKLKKIYNTSHIGHTGTLDPNTTGVLVCAINKACKLMPILIDHDKEYITTILFGVESDTLDITGNIINKKEALFNLEELKNALEILKNKKTQLPPMYSSIKINGKKLYEYARKNIEVEVKEREVSLYDYEILSDIYTIDNLKAFDVKLHVSKGYYVRSFARDLANLLNTCGLMYSLNRTRSGDFSISSSVKIEDIDINKDTISISDVFNHLERIDVNSYLKKLIFNGIVLDERQIKTDKPFLVYCDNKLIAVYEPYKEFMYKPIVLFKE